MTLSHRLYWFQSDRIIYEELCLCYFANSSLIILKLADFGLNELGSVLMSPLNCSKPGYLGKLLPNASARVVDVDTKKDLGPNKTGELYVKNHQESISYVNIKYYPIKNYGHIYEEVTFTGKRGRSTLSIIGKTHNRTTLIAI